MKVGKLQYNPEVNRLGVVDAAGNWLNDYLTCGSWFEVWLDKPQIWQAVRLEYDSESSERDWYLLSETGPGPGDLFAVPENPIGQTVRGLW